MTSKRNKNTKTSKLDGCLDNNNYFIVIIIIILIVYFWWVLLRHRHRNNRRSSDNESEQSGRSSKSHRKHRHRSRKSSTGDDHEHRRHRYQLVESEGQWREVQRRQAEGRSAIQKASVVRPRSGYANSGLESESEISHHSSSYRRRKHRKHR